MFLIFFFFSEMRAAYEVTNDRKNWEIIMGKLSPYRIQLVAVLESAFFPSGSVFVRNADTGISASKI